MITISKDRCIQCGACAGVCPTHHLSMGANGPEVRENLHCLQCMHCSAVCSQKAIHFDFVPTYEEYPDTPEDDTLQLIMTRRSNRHFRTDTPHQDDLAWALDMAQWAPSGKNLHQTRWLVFRGREKCDQIYHAVIDACEAADVAPELVAQRKKGNRDSVTCGCSVVIFALAPDRAMNPDTDAVIAATTLELLLRKCGIGSCWGGYLTHFSRNLPAIQKFLEIPEGYHVACTLLCGYPEDEPYCNIPWRPKAQVDWR